MTFGRRKQEQEKAMAHEYPAINSLAVNIMWLRRGLSPHSTFVVSYLQQRTSDLKVRRLTEANKILNQIMAIPETLRSINAQLLLCVYVLILGRLVRYCSGS